MTTRALSGFSCILAVRAPNMIWPERREDQFPFVAQEMKFSLLAEGLVNDSLSKELITPFLHKPPKSRPSQKQLSSLVSDCSVNFRVMCGERLSRVQTGNKCR